MKIYSILLYSCVSLTLASFFVPEFLDYGMNILFLNWGEYHLFVLQLLLYSFLHGGITHLLMNGVMLWFFGKDLERKIGSTWFLLFFVFTTIINACALLYWNPYVTTIGISWFTLALLGFYTAFFYRVRDPSRKWGAMILLLNTAIGFTIPQISMVGHAVGGVCGICFFFIYLYGRKR